MLEEQPPNYFTVRGQTKGKPSQNGSRVKNEVVVTSNSRVFDELLDKYLAVKLVMAVLGGTGLR